VLRIREAIVVEGRYDKNALAQVVDTVIIETAGFGVFKDGERLKLLRRLAAERGLVVLTDADGAGFVIRNYLKGAIDPALVKHAYIPDTPGKERRKRTPGKEGKLGVEGMRPQVLEQALLRAGVTVLENRTDVSRETSYNQPITKVDLYALGLSGGAGAAERRRDLLKKLELPERMSANAMLAALNIFCTREEILEICSGENKSQ